MIKVFTHIAKAIVAVIAALLFASCTGVNGSGKVVTEDRKVEGHFTKISATSGLEVYVSQGNVSAISVETDDNLQRHIKTEVSGGTLKVFTDKNILSSGAIRVSITLPVVEGIDISGGSSLKGKTVFKTDNITLDSNGGSHVEVTVEAKKLMLDSSGGSHITIGGNTNVLKLDSSGGSTIDAKALVAQTVDADASGGSNATVNALQKLAADASGGAHIYYVGTPTKLDKNVSSGGGVDAQ